MDREASPGAPPRLSPVPAAPATRFPRRSRPAQHGEINLLLFNGLTAHDADDNIVPGLAEKWEYDAETCTYTFHIRDGIQWHDGEKFTADDVKFTIEAIMDPENGSENAPNYEDVEEITVIDDSTVSFRLSEPNVAFLEYMTRQCKRKR